MLRHRSAFIDLLKVVFQVLLEADQSRVYNLELWHNASGNESWSALAFEALPQPIRDASHTPAKSRSKHWFKAKLPRASEKRPIKFTIRFRATGDEGWKWVRDQTGTDDGCLIFQSPISAASAKLSNYFENLSKDLNIEGGRSDTPETTVWTVTAKAAPAEGEKSGYSGHVLGHPKQLMRWFSLVRLWSPWLAPRQGKGAPFAEKDAVLYSFLRSDGLHVVILAISGVEDVLTVFRHEDGNIVISSRNDREAEGDARAIVAVGNTFEKANAAVMYKARSILQPYMQVSAEDQQVVDGLDKKSKDVNATWIQDWYDGFTYCTWNGLGQNLTEEKISSALASLEKNGIRSKTLKTTIRGDPADGW